MEEKGAWATTNVLDDFLCEVNCEELEEEFEAWLQLQNEIQIRYLTFS